MHSTVRRWLPVTLWVAVIYTTIPFVRMLGDWYKRHWDPALITWTVGALLAGGAICGAVALHRRGPKLRRGAIPWMIAVTAVLLAWAFRLRESPEEAVHLLEYGVLAVLIHRALAPSGSAPMVFIAGALVGSLVGTVDEIIQWVTPSRYWDWRDIALNSGAGALVQLALWRASPPAQGRPSIPSIRVVLRLSAVQTILLILCLANTPRIVAVYAPLLPGAGHLMSTVNPMAEYGHLHRIDGLGSFKSRLTLGELANQDRERGAEVAGLVDAAKRSYGRFLDSWPVADDPFTYEMRVHLFARNRNLGKAREAGFESAVARSQLATARDENRLLERFFGASLEHSSYVWPGPLRDRVEAAAAETTRFRSDAGSHLITFAPEQALRGVLVAAVLLLVGIDLWLVRWRER